MVSVENSNGTSKAITSPKESSSTSVFTNGSSPEALLLQGASRRPAWSLGVSGTPWHPWKPVVDESVTTGLAGDLAASSPKPLTQAPTSLLPAALNHSGATALSIVGAQKFVPRNIELFSNRIGKLQRMRLRRNANGNSEQSQQLYCTVVPFLPRLRMRTISHGHSPLSLRPISSPTCQLPLFLTSLRSQPQIALRSTPRCRS